MASLLTIKQGLNPLVYTGTSTLVLANQPWYTPAYVSQFYLPAPNNKTWGAGDPTKPTFGVTQVPVAAAGNRVGVVLIAKQDFTVDAGLFGPLPKPVISSIGKSSVAAGDLLNITGTDFDTAAYVLIGGVSAAITTSSITTTNITVTVPLAVAAGSNVPVVVITVGGFSNVLATLTITSSGQAKLAKPVINTPVSITSTSAYFTWPAVTGADSYNFRLNNGTAIPLGNVTSYTPTGLSPATDVVGEVQAKDSTGVKASSDYSLPITATTTAYKVAVLVFGTSLYKGYYAGQDHANSAIDTLLKTRVSVANITIDYFNFAVSGAQCSDALTNLDNNLATVPLTTYDKVIGIEAFAVNEIIRNVSVATTYANIKSLHARLQAKGIDTMSVTSSTLFSDTAYAQLNTGVSATAARAGIEDVDAHKRADIYSVLHAKGYADLSSVNVFNYHASSTPDYTVYQQDDLHLTPKGYDLEADAIAPCLMAVIQGNTFGTVVPYTPSASYYGAVAEETIEAESTDTNKIAFRGGPWNLVTSSLLSNGQGRSLNPGQVAGFDVYFTEARYLIFEGPCGPQQTSQRGPFQLTLDNNAPVAASQAYQNPDGTDGIFAYYIVDYGTTTTSIHHKASADFAPNSGNYVLVDRVRVSNTLPAIYGYLYSAPAGTGAGTAPATASTPAASDMRYAPNATAYTLASFPNLSVDSTTQIGRLLDQTVHAAFDTGYKLAAGTTGGFGIYLDNTTGATISDYLDAVIGFSKSPGLEPYTSFYAAAYNSEDGQGQNTGHYYNIYSGQNPLYSASSPAVVGTKGDILYVWRRTIGQPLTVEVLRNGTWMIVGFLNAFAPYDGDLYPKGDVVPSSSNNSRFACLQGQGLILA